jgi:hypothetical protein
MTTASQCLYLNTIIKLFKGGIRGVEFELPQPVVLYATNVMIKALHTSNPDDRILIFPLGFDTPSLDPITALSERVGGKLNGTLIELGIRDIIVVNGDLHIPFFGLHTPYPLGPLSTCDLRIEIV